jgi:hypothetical protein
MNKVGKVGMTILRRVRATFSPPQLSMSLEQSSYSIHWQEISHLVWKPKFYYRVLNTQSPDPVLSPMYPVQNHILHLPVHFVFSHLRLGLPRGVDFSGSPTKILHRVLAYSMSHISPTCLLLLFFITRDSSDRSENYMLWISSLSSFLYIPVTSTMQITDDNRTAHFVRI